MRRGRPQYFEDHKVAGTPIHNAWMNMKKRCYDENHESYHNYGGKGIVVCQRWLDSFMDFYNDMFPTWQAGLTLDRIVSTGNYEPSNCKWSTRIEQIRNRSCTNLVTYNGETLSITEWGRKVNMHRDLFKKRLANGWTIEQLLAQPYIKRWSRPDRQN